MENFPRNEQIWEIILDVRDKEDGEEVNQVSLMSELGTIFNKSEKYDFEIIPCLNGHYKFMIRLTKK